MPADLNANEQAIVNAIAPHAAGLRPGAGEQLARIWGPELGDLPAPALARIVAAKLDSPDVAHFKAAPAPVVAPPTPDQLLLAHAVELQKRQTPGLFTPYGLAARSPRR
jgi:hypothetical protein